ncbi:MAG: cytochrome C [Gammaproteobacteria bacterium]|nr:cytochrome C [Gammaproteobacteria bacterium]MBU1482184.1 cytochrome C [Gammaproteobacteria bacterium]
MRTISILKTFGRAFIFAVVALFCAVNAHADSANDLLMPGKVIQGHFKYESDCNNCHKPYDKAAQSGLCKDCHKEVAKDIDEKQGYHGLMQEEKPCKECHTDHKGRDARIAKLSTVNFDHDTTGYVLKGGHLNGKVLCKDCHYPQKKYRDAPTKCNGCHQKADKHKGSLGPECQNCHEEKDWKTTHFDHSKTHFDLLDKHKEVKCKACHPKDKFKDTPKLCNDCHKKDDKHKGSFGPKCETCHNAASWKEILFDHDKKTKYPLLGKHRDAKCVGCHKGNPYKEKLKKDCNSCHRKDDKHKGKFGPKCEACHTERSWKEIPFDHDRKTKYPLRGKHRDIKCVDCHKGDIYKDKLKQDCYSCHKKDDKHEGQEGKKCETCHNEQSWKKAKFDHRLSRYPLTGKHQITECKKCHPTARYKDAKSDCWSCHEKQDKESHKRSMGTDCKTCHNTRDWKSWDFNHDKTGFKLQGKHKDIKCAGCHKTPVFKKMKLASSCVSCHDKDDKHDGSFGRRCEQCHVGSSWKTIVGDGWKELRIGGQRWRQK